MLRDPPQTAKPMTRWWWFGGAVTKPEITRELTFMKDAGLRGAEIQPVYPVAVDAPERGIHNLRYFSAEWFDVLRHTVAEARRLGLQLDFTLGSGWPYGGPFITTALSARRVWALTRDFVRPREITWELTAQLTGDDRVVGVVAAPLTAESQPHLEQVRVLAGQPRSEAQGPNRGTWVRDVDLPEGRWRVLVVLDSPTGQQVKRPTVGMEGPVLDHHSREAMQLFLRAAGDRVMNGLGPSAPPPFHSVFCDSLEVYGADWTGDLLTEFQTRRGYDLAPLLPALWDEAGPETPHVRHDYHLTLSELTLERFFRPLADWAVGRKMKARIQAHGAMGDVIQAYGVADIPEGETIFQGDRYAVNLRHRRLASSAGHLYGKPVLSAEAYTWLRTPMYMATLEQMKACSDAHFLDGINQLVNHGYAYSPPEAGAPGWSFYASTEVNHTNTWWRHYPHLARYVQAACALLQDGIAVNPIAVYVPLADIYAATGAGGLHLDVEIDRRLSGEPFDRLRQAGYDFDLVQDHALQALARVEGQQLRIGTGRYSVALVPNVRWMPPESADRLLELAQAGGHVVFVERLPEAAPGLADQSARSARLTRALNAMGGGPALSKGATAKTGKGMVSLVADHAAALARIAAVLAPDFTILDRSPEDANARRGAIESVGFTHRRSGPVDLYFVANVSDEQRPMRVRFDVGHRAPERWDLERRSVEAPAVYDYVTASGRPMTEMELVLEPFESCAVVFGASREKAALARTGCSFSLNFVRSAGGAEAVGWAAEPGRFEFKRPSGRIEVVQVGELPAPRAIDGPWRLSLSGGAPLELPRLVSWIELAEGRSFSGWGTYEVEFEGPPAGDGIEWLLDLGTVHETAEVALNGRSLGAAWKGARRLSGGKALQPGRNHLKVEVANLWIHHVLHREPPDLSEMEETFGIRWGRYGEVKPERVPPAGLLGPVRLVALKRVSVRV
jgi:alpha-L-rhamnosidase